MTATRAPWQFSRSTDTPKAPYAAGFPCQPSLITIVMREFCEEDPLKPSPDMTSMAKFDQSPPDTSEPRRVQYLPLMFAVANV